MYENIKKTLPPELIKALELEYQLIPPDNLLDILLSGEIVMGADLSLISVFPSIRIAPHNAFIYQQKTNTLEVFVGKNVLSNPPQKELIINREFNFPSDPEETKVLLQEYIDRFMLQKYDFFFIPSADEIRKIEYPSVPILHISMLEARTWLYG